jgi:DNA-binding LacI/PurR family transcriptional regulator
MPQSKSEKLKRRPSPARPVTMADLARLAGVSKITVSRAMGESAIVNAKTRAKIRALAVRHGYKLNVSARNLRLRRDHTVAVIVEMTPSADRPMSHPYPLDLLGGILQELADNNFSALVTTRRGASLPTIQSADAVILLGQGAHLDAVHMFEHLRVPLVIWGANKGDGGRVVVGSDNRQGGAAAAERFVSIGRRHAVFLGDTSHAELAERLAGFESALAPHGIHATELRCKDFTIEAGYRAVKSLVQRHHRFDAVFAGSDLLAMGAVRALSELGHSVPADVSVIGYDDMLLAASFIPPLTTVHQNWSDGGRLLARKALALVNDQPAESEMLPNHLVIRAT